MSLSRKVRNLFLAGLVGVTLLSSVVACTPTQTPNRPDYPTNTPTPAEVYSPSPTDTLVPADTATATNTVTPPSSPTVVPSPTIDDIKFTPEPTNTPTPPPPPTPTPKPFIEYAKQMFRPYSENAQVSKVAGPYWVNDEFHSGIDVDMPVGNPVFASLDGIVLLVYEFKKAPPGSYSVYMEHNVNSFVFWTRYGHVKDPLVSKGQFVSACERIASSYGNPIFDPYSSEPHIQFDIFLEYPISSHLDRSNSPIKEGNWENILNVMSFCD